MNTSGNTKRTRLRNLMLGCSVGALTALGSATALNAQDDLSNSRLGRFLNNNQSGFNNQPGFDPVQRGVGETARGLLQGQNFGDAVQSGIQAGVDQTYRNNDPYYGNSYNNSPAGYYNGRPYYYRNGQRFYYDDSQRFYGQNQQGYQGQRYYQGQSGQGFNAGVQSNVVTRWDVNGQPYQVRLDNRTGARLGVSLDRGDEGVMIQAVSRNSAAASAGLQADDTIVSINGESVNDPQQVVDMVGQRSPGDDLELVVMRNGERQTINATLKGFPDSDRQSVARPRMDGGNMNGNMSSIQQLQREVQSLRRQVDRLNQQLGINANAGASLDGNADAGAAITDEADIDTSNTLDADGETGVQVDDEGINADGNLNLDSDSSGSKIGADAGANAETDFDASEIVGEATADDEN